MLLLAIVSTTWQAFAVASLLAVGSAGGWPSQTSILARLVPSQQRPWLFGVQFMLLNLGIGVGGLVSATFVDTGRPGTFQTLYVLDAVSYLVYAAVIVWLPATLGREPSPDDEATATGDSTSGGYREVLADRVFMRLFMVAAVLVLFGYAQIEVGFTAYATQVVDAPARWLGIACAANTATIVFGQLFILSRLEGKSRSRALALVGAIWGMSWLVIAAAGFAPSTFLIVAALAVGASCFAVGEIIWSPVFPALVNDLAPEHLRGRYNAVASAAWNVGNLLGPVYAGVLIGADLGGLWVAVTMLGCLGGAAGALRLRAHLQTQQDGRPAGSGDTMAA